MTIQPNDPTEMNNIDPIGSLIINLMGDFAMHCELNNPQVLEVYKAAWNAPFKHYRFLGDSAFKFAVTHYLSKRYPDFDDDTMNVICAPIRRMQSFLDCLNEAYEVDCIDKDNFHAIIGVTQAHFGVDTVLAWTKSVLDPIIAESCSQLLNGIPRSLLRSIQGTEHNTIAGLIKSCGGDYQEDCVQVPTTSFSNDYQWRWHIYYQLGPNAQWYGHSKTAPRKRAAKTAGEQEILAYYRNDRSILEKHKEALTYFPSRSDISMLPIKLLDPNEMEMDGGQMNDNCFQQDGHTIFVPSSPKNATQEEMAEYYENFKRTLLGLGDLTTNEPNKQMYTSQVEVPSPGPLLPTRTALEIHASENSPDQILRVRECLDTTLRHVVLKEYKQSINLKEAMDKIVKGTQGHLDTTFVVKGLTHNPLYQATCLLTVGENHIQATHEAPRKKHAETMAMKAILEMLAE